MEKEGVGINRKRKRRRGKGRKIVGKCPKHTDTFGPSEYNHKASNHFQTLKFSEEKHNHEHYSVGAASPYSAPKHAASSFVRPQLSSKSSSFLDKMKARLSGGHFRMLNERLYTCSGDEALKYFKEDPSLFNVYHTGYQEQMSHWPEQPVNIFIKWLKVRSPSLVVADFGCGDAQLAKNVKNKVFSIDLVSSDPAVIVCDMANTPLNSSSVDVAIFCLSLMGTSYADYLQEARRVLKRSGWLLIAEVKSRFDPNTGGADPNKFSKAICELGFTLAKKDFSNKMFILWYFTRKGQRISGENEIEWPQLKPCIYKRR